MGLVVALHLFVPNRFPFVSNDLSFHCLCVAFRIVISYFFTFFVQLEESFFFLFADQQQKYADKQPPRSLPLIVSY